MLPSGNTRHQSVKVGGDRLKHLQYLQAAPAHEGSLAAAQTLPSLRCPLSLTALFQQSTTAPCNQSWYSTDQAWPLDKLPLPRGQTGTPGSGCCSVGTGCDRARTARFRQTPMSSAVPLSVGWCPRDTVRPRRSGWERPLSPHGRLFSGDWPAAADF